MARSTGLGYRRGYQIDRESVIVGAVRGATKGAAAATRTGAPLLLSTSVNNMSEFRAVLAGQSSNSAGGYLLRFAHVPLDKPIADAAGWSTLAVLSVSGQRISEVVLSGKQVYDAVYARAVTGLAVTASALTSNVVTLTVGSGHGYAVGDFVTVAGMTSAGAPMNGTYAVSAIADTTISYELTNADIANGGTAGRVYGGKYQTPASEELRVMCVRAIAGTGSNGAASPAGTNTLFLDPLASDA
jgi:hypothetical protein